MSIWCYDAKAGGMGFTADFEYSRAQDMMRIRPQCFGPDKLMMDLVLLNRANNANAAEGRVSIRMNNLEMLCDLTDTPSTT